MAKKVSNQYTGSPTLTQREAETLRGCMNKLAVIANRERYVVEKRKLLEVIVAMRQIVIDADRGYVL